MTHIEIYKECFLNNSIFVTRAQQKKKLSFICGSHSFISNDPLNRIAFNLRRLNFFYFLSLSFYLLCVIFFFFSDHQMFELTKKIIYFLLLLLWKSTKSAASIQFINLQEATKKNRQWENDECNTIAHQNLLYLVDN